ncbi:hypothetical protein GCM10023196_045010 [Actinoallomurus vinaceus]|uniref:Uncharacterized protein n=1 Tax=Actinoallomurus vinaceus TaxID=1080074 RepID=A0ABP8UBR6_9ACTN
MIAISSKEGLSRLSLLWRQTPCAAAYEARIASELTRPGYEWISEDLAGLPVREIAAFNYDGDTYDLSVYEDANLVSGIGGLLTCSADQAASRAW